MANIAPKHTKETFDQVTLVRKRKRLVSISPAPVKMEDAMAIFKKMFSKTLNTKIVELEYKIRLLKLILWLTP